MLQVRAAIRRLGDCTRFLSSGLDDTRPSASGRRFHLEPPSLPPCPGHGCPGSGSFCSLSCGFDFAIPTEHPRLELALASERLAFDA